MWSFLMTNEFVHVPEEDQLRLSEVRSDLILWIVERFRYLRDSGRDDDAVYFADEWFEWLSPDDYINESTTFYNENELQELYKSVND